MDALYNVDSIKTIKLVTDSRSRILVYTERERPKSVDVVDMPYEWYREYKSIDLSGLGVMSYSNVWSNWDVAFGRESYVLLNRPHNDILAGMTHNTSYSTYDIFPEISIYVRDLPKLSAEEMSVYSMLDDLVITLKFNNLTEIFNTYMQPLQYDGDKSAAFTYVKSLSKMAEDGITFRDFDNMLEPGLGDMFRGM